MLQVGRIILLQERLIILLQGGLIILYSRGKHWFCQVTKHLKQEGLESFYTPGKLIILFQVGLIVLLPVGLIILLQEELIILLQGGALGQLGYQTS